MRLLMAVCGGAVCLIAVLAMLGMMGWILPETSGRIWGNSSAAWGSRFLIGLVLIGLTRERPPWQRIGSVFCSSIVLVLALCSAVAPQELGSPFYIPALTSITLLCFALATLYLESELELALASVPWLGIAGLFLNAMTLLGYLYDAGPLYGGATGTVGICSAATSLLLGVGLVAAAGPRRQPLRLLAGESITSQLLRSLLPVTCGAMLLGEIVSDVIREGARDAAAQDALQTFFITIFVTGVVLLLARRVGGRLDRAERERDRAEAALSALNASLATAVADRTAELQKVNVDLRAQVASRVQTERALVESEAKNIALLSALPDWIFRLGLDGTVLDLRSPRESNEPRDAGERESLASGLTEKVVEWVRQNSSHLEIQTVDFQFPSEGTTYEARFVRSGENEFLAIVRDISDLTRLEREVLEASAQEQRRIGEELHDGVGQQLTAIAFMSKILELSLRERNMSEAEQAADIGRQVSSAIGTIRSLARGLFRYELGSDCLIAALQDLTNAADKNFRIKCTLDADASITLSDRAANLHLYRISQEAISNAVKHGKATKVHVQLKREASKIIFSIKDDGIGVNHANGRHGGIGLRTMEFRTRRLGGRLGIESHPGKGTLITCTLPDPTACELPQIDPQKQLNLLL